MAQWASGDSLGALGALDQLIKENAKDADGLVLRGQIKQSMGKYDSAAEDFLKAISVDEKCYEAYFGCYNVYNDAGKAMRKMCLKNWYQYMAQMQKPKRRSDELIFVWISLQMQRIY